MRDSIAALGCDRPAAPPYTLRAKKVAVDAVARGWRLPTALKAGFLAEARLVERAVADATVEGTALVAMVTEAEVVRAQVRAATVAGVVAALMEEEVGGLMAAPQAVVAAAEGLGAKANAVVNLAARDSQASAEATWAVEEMGMVERLVVLAVV